MKKLLSLVCAIAIMVMVCSPLTAQAHDGPVFAPNPNAADTILEDEFTDEYIDENGLIVEKTTKIYGYPARARASEIKKTATTTYTLKHQGEGSLVTITLDADFYYQTNVENSVRCPRYYSSYDVYREDLLISYEEDDMSYSQGAKSAKVTTTYPLKYKYGVLGATESKRVSLWVSCNYLGNVSTS